jgi:TonB family protein
LKIYDTMLLLSMRRGSALLAVALLHLAVGYAFYSGLAGTLMKRLDPPPFHLVEDPRHPLRVGNDFYPDASRRAGETGRCRVQVTVAADGRIVASLLEQRTGFERLDKACLDAVKRQRMNPAIEGGKAVESRVSIPIYCRLAE